MYLTATAEETFAQAFIREVNNDLNDVKHSFIRIGFRLREANEFQYYKELGYQNITELAEAEFGFKKTTTYELMNVHELAHDPNYRWGIAEKYDKYSYSQLLALTYLKYSTRNAMFIVQPTDSVRKIKRFVSVWNREAKLYSYYDAYPIKSVDEYLKAYDKEQDQEQEQTSASEYVGQLPGQIALSLQEPVEYEEESDEPDEEFSERSVKLEKEEVQQTPKREYLLTVKKETVGRLMVAFVSDNYDMESEKVCKIEGELHRQLNGKFSSYHFSDLAEFITESDVSAEKYTEAYCSILALLGVEVTE